MICCLNPKCQHPQNPDDREVCQSCSQPLIALLRNRYRPVRLIGQGGFGRTYLALDEDRLQTRCVIKQFAPQTQGTKSLEKAIRLFNQEAVRLHELGEHPQIPALLAYFEQDEYLYLVQQFIEGQTLNQEAQGKGGLDEAEIRVLLNDLLPILRFVHRHHVVHRDITPSNIIRRQLDDKLVLIDFGVAKQLSAAGLSQPGTKIGTEGYSPIEQLRSGRVYPSSDLYSLGATCLYLMTLTKPDELYNPLDGQWLWREKLQQRGIQVSDRIAYILNKLVEDLVSHRYQSADEVLADLNTYPVSMPPTQIPRSRSASTSASSPPSGGSAAASSKPANSRPTPSRPPTASPRPSRPPVSSPPRSRSSRPPISGGTRRPGWNCIRMLEGHSSWVMAVTLSLKPPSIISGGMDDTVRVWNARTGQEIHRLRGHARGVNAVAVSPDSRIVASCGDDDTVRIWDFSTGELVYTLTDHTRDVTSVVISSDSRMLASGSEDKTIRLWDVHRGELLQTLVGSSGMIRAIALDEAGQHLASGGMDNKVRLWNLQTGTMTQVLSGHFNTVNAVAFTPDGSKVISASKDRTIRIWETATGQLLHTLTDHTREVNAIAVSHNGKSLVSGSSDATIRVWDLQTAALQHTLSDHSNAVKSVAITPNASIIVSGSLDKTVRIWQYLN
jgi:WD40 repeat protein/tRNA A-37 threonylcarbamoyl transferase component Bud32